MITTTEPLDDAVQEENDRLRKENDTLKMKLTDAEWSLKSTTTEFRAIQMYAKLLEMLLEKLLRKRKEESDK